MEKELKILMLEDLEDDALLIDRALRKEKFAFTRVRVETQDEFTNALETFKPDVILSDHSLPQFNSIAALTICQERKLNLPFLLVTGSVSEEFAVNSLKKGADDYVLKSNLARLPMAIRYALRHRRQERIRKEQDEMLRNQNEELVKINKELDSFVYSVSHNLRSPLASVLGLVNVAMLDELKDRDMVDGYFQMIRKSISKLDGTLREILNYSRNARSDVVISEINLDQLVRQSFAEMKYLQGHHDISKRIEIENAIPFYSDGYRLSIILANLIANSIQYCDEGKDNSFIQVSATITPAHAIVHILDNGVGINRDYLPEIFNMFYRASEKSDGAGLGLYIVKETLERLHGRVAVTSRLGEGTDITLTIPNTFLKENSTFSLLPPQTIEEVAEIPFPGLKLMEK
ncbi:MAG TPA: ATP-binding protein [Cyclobacteriaceae bacterium]|jgi:signal transduction histidine kinase|nr:ATP-binding protein [Cyclobacteriaceae bacterium]